MNLLAPEPELSRLQRTLLIVSTAFTGFAIPTSTAALNIGTLFLLLCWLGMAPLRAHMALAMRKPLLRACLGLYLLLLVGTLWAEVDWSARLQMLN